MNPMTTTTQPTPRSNSPAPAWTPGPWKAHEIQRTGIPYSPVTATTMIAKVYPTAYGDDAQSQANARLIAAAPEMAELLAQAHAYVQGEAPGHELDQAIRALLARINGHNPP